MAEGSPDKGLPAARSGRPVVWGRRFVVAAGHPLAAEAGAAILRRGGNAIDAGVAAGICLNVLQPDMTNFGGVAPIVLYHAGRREVRSISGLGWWPRKASLEHFQREYGGVLPRGVLRAVVPAAPDAWLTALERFGTLRFEDVVAPALELAERGFPVYQQLAEVLRNRADMLREWPSTAAIFLPGGRPPIEGQVLVQRDLASTFQRLVDAERAAAGSGREAAIRAARDRFYTGDIAEEMARFCREQGGWLDEEDLAAFHVEVETPPAIDYHGTRVYGTGAWCQGPLLLEGLNIAAGLDLAGLGHNTPDYAHALSEAFLLAFADREAYIGDPRFMDVPLEGLLSDGYAAAQRARIGARASGALPPPGDPWPFQGHAGRAAVGAAPQPVAGPYGASTSYCCVIDEQGNGFSATPSDVLDWTPIVPGLGFLPSGRGLQSRLDPSHPSVLAPGKRPRLTPNPALAMRGDELFMTWGTPGGDMQAQAMAQAFLNVVEFGMDVQSAVEAPRFGTFSYPDSFAPHAYTPGLFRAESRIADETRRALAERGHLVQDWRPWEPEAGGLCLITRDADGTLAGGADPRRACYAVGW